MDEKVLAAAKQLLFNAVNHDRAGRTVEACRAYTDGIEMLLQLMSGKKGLERRNKYNTDFFLSKVNYWFILIFHVSKA